MARTGAVDALGNALVDTADYYIQDASTYVGDFILWWRPNGAGYTCDLDRAGVYKGADHAINRRPTDIAWPVDIARGATVRVVDSEKLRRVDAEGEKKRAAAFQRLKGARRG